MKLTLKISLDGLGQGSKLAIADPPSNLIVGIVYIKKKKPGQIARAS